MTHFTQTIEIHASTQRVWEIMSDIERWPEWTPSVTQVQRLDVGPLAVGSRACIRQPKLLPAVWLITEWVEGKKFTWISKAPGIRATASHIVEPCGHGARATLSVQYSGVLGGLIGFLLGALTVRYMALEARGLQERSEGVRESSPEFSSRTS